MPKGSDQFWTKADLASNMRLSTKSVMRWSLRLNVPPTIRRHSCVRWSQTAAHLLLRRWHQHREPAVEPVQP